MKVQASIRGGEILHAGTQVEINWISDDDKGVHHVDILLSTDGGESFPTPVAAATADDGSFLWTVPDIDTPTARLRVVVSDEDNHTGYDQSDGDLVITTARATGASRARGAGR